MTLPWCLPALAHTDPLTNISQVRRMAAQNFGEFAKKLTPREVQEELLTPFKKLAADEQVIHLLFHPLGDSLQDSVRIQVVTICISLTQIFPPELKVLQPPSFLLLSPFPG